jgi:hypothetical protein
VAGGACWALAQVLEKLQWVDGAPRPDLYVGMMLTEEALEIIGSTLFLASVAHIAVATRDGVSDPGRRPVADPMSRRI